MKDKLTKITVTLSYVLPLMVFGAEAPIQGVPSSSINSVAGLAGLLNNLIDWGFYFILLISVAFFLYAGFIYVTQGGDEDATKKAKNMIIYAVLGVAIALLSQGFLYIAGALTGVSVSSPGF